jgi:hypothetical protein
MAPVKFFLGNTGGSSPRGMARVLRREGIRVNRVNRRREVSVPPVLRRFDSHPCPCNGP